MRVTQSMLSNNMLRNLNTNYSKMGKLQEQINSGSKISRPSDDPVVAVKGMQYRVDVDKIEQFQRNISDAHTWLDSTDTALGLVGDSLQRVKELLVQAANDTNTEEDRKKIASEISQIKNQIKDVANTKVGENYIFSGTHTDQPLYLADGTPNPAVDSGKEKPIDINVYDGVSININTNTKGLFENIDNFMNEAVSLLENGKTGAEIGAALGIEINPSGGGTTPIPALDQVTNDALTLRAEVGARQNRVDLMENRLDLQNVNITKQLSENEDTDYAQAITEMTTAESIHQASLSVGSKIIQQTLVDFIR